MGSPYAIFAGFAIREKDDDDIMIRYSVVALMAR